ncbi:hypothetical protein RN001_008824 [Aquatica leii]|uniref:Uncharacterized protein n=1 Tax=Aquatica leii TaxID=1421715 RepID=A0AAN7SPD8_9COLE|nr:hypothetical protein RN001_008824 [Aquatica leii]
MASKLNKTKDKRNIALVQETHTIALKAKIDSNVVPLFKAYCDRIENVYENFCDNHNQVIGLIPDDDNAFEEQDTVRAQADKMYFEIKSVQSQIYPIPPVSFYGRGTFSTLQESVEAVIKLDLPSTENVQLIAIPPSPDSETDCEGFDEDDLLNDNVQDIPGMVEVEATDAGNSDIQEVQMGSKKQHVLCANCR